MLHRLVAFFTASLGLAIGLQSFANAETITVTPHGEYAQIDTRLANNTIQTLTQGSPAEQQETIAHVTAHPENYAPPVLCRAIARSV